MASTTVLIGFAEALAAPEVVWSLVEAGFRVEAFARKGRRSAIRHSRHVICHEICAPESNIEQSLAELRILIGSLGSKENSETHVLFPLDDKAVWLCSHLEIEKPWLLAGPTGSSAKLALEKHIQIAAAKTAGFRVPNSALVHNAAELLDFSASQSFPIILKADECVPIYEKRVYSCRKWICANRNELDLAVNEWKERVPLLAQAFITGVGEGAFGLAAPDGVRAWSGHHRVRMMNPQGSGSSACESQPVTETVKENTRRMMNNTLWRGLFMIELLRDEQGNEWFVELNGRPWGSMALCRRQGFEYPAWHVALEMNPNAPVGKDAPKGFSMVCRNAGREFMHVLFVLKGAKSKALNRWPSFWKTLWDVLHFRKKDGLYNWHQDDMKVFLADFYYTIHGNIFKSKH